MPVAHAADGAALAYETVGSGPPLVLVHGITDCRRSWDPLLAPLAADHRVIAVDLRGHGESARIPPYDVFTMADDLRVVLDDAGVTDPLLVGHSLGGVVVTVYASRFPTRAVVNVDQPLHLAGFKETVTSFEPMLRGDDASFRAVMDGMMEMLYGALSPDERARVDAQLSAEQDVVVGVWDMVMSTSLDDLDALVRGFTGSIDVPYLALLGNDPGDYEAWLKTLIPQATVEAWPDDGHFMHLVEPERFVQRVREFERTL